MLDLRRRQFLTLLGGASVACPLAARAQQRERVRHIGVLMNLGSDDAEGQARNAAFLQGLQELGWTVGRNVRIEYRWGAGDAELFRRYASELVALAPDVILAGGGAVVPPLLQATRTVPIVFTGTPDPVGAGFVESLSRPGGNVTGFTPFEFGISGKWPELLKEVAPGVTRVALLRILQWPPVLGSWGHPVRGTLVGGEAAPPRRTRCTRDRARYHGLCAFPKRRPDCNGQQFGRGSSPFDRDAGGPTQIARRLL